jgi:hypothetical protein
LGGGRSAAGAVAEPEMSSSATGGGTNPELVRSLAALKGQAHFLLYLADQLDGALAQLDDAPDDPAHRAFLAKVLGMYSSQLESRHHGLADRVAETCQELYLVVRELDAE